MRGLRARGGGERALRAQVRAVRRPGCRRGARPRRYWAGQSRAHRGAGARGCRRPGCRLPGRSFGVLKTVPWATTTSGYAAYASAAPTSRSGSPWRRCSTTWSPSRRQRPASWRSCSRATGQWPAERGRPSGGTVRAAAAGCWLLLSPAPASARGQARSARRVGGWARCGATASPTRATPRRLLPRRGRVVLRLAPLMRGFGFVRYYDRRDEGAGLQHAQGAECAGRGTIARSHDFG